MRQVFGRVKLYAQRENQLGRRTRRAYAARVFESGRTIRQVVSRLMWKMRGRNFRVSPASES